jgi:glutamyl-tRNA synthetase
VKKYWKGENPTKLLEVRDMLAAIEDFSIENTDAALHEWIERTGYSAGQIINTLRLSVVGACKGPGMFDVLALVGKDEVLKRIDAAVAQLGLGGE